MRVFEEIPALGAKFLISQRPQLTYESPGNGVTAKPTWPVRRDAGISSYDIPTRDKIPVIRKLLALKGTGYALDIGSGTGYTTSRVFCDRPTVCADLHAPNLHYYRRSMSLPGSDPDSPCVVANAIALPFKDGVFRFVLCSEVLEHLENDAAAVKEMSRVLASDGMAIITVPYNKLGFTSFLELLKIKTVHDFPGPEQHIRSGYDEHSLRDLCARYGLSVDRHEYYLRFFTRLVTDFVSLCHLAYQRTRHGRASWSWSDAADAEGSMAFRVYRRILPALWLFSRLDFFLRRLRGFGLVVAARKNSTKRQ